MKSCPPPLAEKVGGGGERRRALRIPSLDILLVCDFYVINNVSTKKKKKYRAIQNLNQIETFMNTYFNILPSITTLKAPEAYCKKPPSIFFSLSFFFLLFFAFFVRHNYEQFNHLRGYLYMSSSQ